MVETARKTNRMVQVGSQSRSTPHKIRAMQLLKEGVIGPVYMAKGLCFKRRKSIGKTPPEPVPAGLDWDRFLGPAPMRPYTKNRFAYNWHWFWDTGNGDIGNQGVHEMDICRWGLGEAAMPKSAVSNGGKYVYDDDQETPNTQLSTLDYGDKEIVFEVRGLLTGPEGGLPVKGGNTVGNLFLGGDGWMWVDGGGFQVYKGEANEKVMDEKGADREGTVLHMKNFLEACRSRNHKQLTAEIEIGAMSATLCHLANVSQRIGRKLFWDAAKRKFVNDPEADKLLTRDYRKPYVV
jgi:predicted dehydrogenase